MRIYTCAQVWIRVRVCACYRMLMCTCLRLWAQVYVRPHAHVGACAHVDVSTHARVDVYTYLCEWMIILEWITIYTLIYSKQQLISQPYYSKRQKTTTQKWVTRSYKRTKENVTRGLWKRPAEPSNGLPRGNQRGCESLPSLQGIIPADFCTFSHFYKMN